MTREAISFFVPGTPIAFARAGSNGARRFTPAKQRAYAETIQWIARKVFIGHGKFDGPVRMTARFVFEIPKSYSVKRRNAMKWKDTKPDLDNMVKLCADSLNQIAYHDDAQICELVAQKQYGVAAGVTIMIEALEPSA